MDPGNLIVLGAQSSDGWGSPPVLVAMAGAIANLLVVIAAVGVPLWQARREDNYRAEALADAKEQMKGAVGDCFRLVENVLSLIDDERFARTDVLNLWSGVMSTLDGRLEQAAAKPGITAPWVALAHGCKQLIVFVRENAPATSGPPEELRRDRDTFSTVLRVTLDTLKAEQEALTRPAPTAVIRHR